MPKKLYPLFNIARKIKVLKREGKKPYKSHEILFIRIGEQHMCVGRGRMTFAGWLSIFLYSQNLWHKIYFRGNYCVAAAARRYGFFLFHR